jgi:nucleoside 2-deoxyribosyltransferase
MANLYVASAFANKPAVRDLMARLKDAGHTVTWDWTVEDASHLKPGSPEWTAYLQACGRRDMTGIAVSDAVIVLAHQDMKDTRFEMGYAVGRGMPVFVLDADRTVSVFWSACVLVDSVEDLLRRLADAA